MNCPNCDELLPPNTIHCNNCETYLPSTHIQFTVHQPSRSVMRYLLLAVAVIMAGWGILLLLISIYIYFPPILGVIALLGIPTLIFAFNNSTTYYDCPNCRAEKSILVKQKMIKSHCKYCGEKYDFAPVA